MAVSSKGIYLERELIESQAFRALTKTATYIYLIFLLKQRKAQRKISGRKKVWVTINNGEIEL